MKAAQTLVTRGFELVFEFHLIGAHVSGWCLFTRRPALESLVAGHQIDLDVKAAQILAPHGFELGFDFYLLGAHVSGWCLFPPFPALGPLVAGHRINLDANAAQTLALHGFELIFEFYLIGARLRGWCLFTPRPTRSDHLPSCADFMATPEVFYQECRAWVPLRTSACIRGRTAKGFRSPPFGRQLRR